MSPNLSIDGDRLWSALMETAAFGATPDGGVRRLALSEEDRRVRDWFAAQCEAAGCAISVDGLGNMSALRPGQDPDALPVAFGSHLDTQPSGGKFDGILGVLAGLEIMRTLAELDVVTQRPLLLINWTNEEGSRFSPAMMGSGVAAGVFSRDEILAIRDGPGASLGEALDAIGYRGEAESAGSFDAYFELHIEQGPILEAEDKTIGVVTGVQGISWMRLSVEGRAAHAGTTPMDLRRDAMMAAAEAMLDIRSSALANDALATFGTLEIEDASHNVVPGRVRTTLDLRAQRQDSLDMVEAAIAALAADSRYSRTPISVERFWHNPPVVFDADCVALVEASAQRLGYPSRRIVSGAGHDAAYMARVVPTAMIFIPCRDGLSHNPAESATPEHCTAGAQVLLDAVIARAGLAQDRGRP